MLSNDSRVPMVLPTPSEVNILLSQIQLYIMNVDFELRQLTPEFERQVRTIPAQLSIPGRFQNSPAQILPNRQFQSRVSLYEEKVAFFQHQKNLMLLLGDQLLAYQNVFAGRVSSEYSQFFVYDEPDMAGPLIRARMATCARTRNFASYESIPQSQRFPVMVFLSIDRMLSRLTLHQMMRKQTWQMEEECLRADEGSWWYRQIPLGFMS